VRVRRKTREMPPNWHTHVAETIGQDLGGNEKSS
jgi:hypothetical protein